MAGARGARSALAAAAIAVSTVVGTVAAAWISPFQVSYDISRILKRHFTRIEDSHIALLELMQEGEPSLGDHARLKVRHNSLVVVGPLGSQVKVWMLLRLLEQD